MASCLGSWKVRGELADSRARMACTETYEWAPGHYFIVYRFDRQIGAQKHQGNGLIGYDDTRRAHFAYFVDNMGYSRAYDLHIENNRWIFSGQWERATLTFDSKENHMGAHWEHSSDGESWRVLCDFEGRRE